MSERGQAEKIKRHLGGASGTIDVRDDVGVVTPILLLGA